MNFIRLFQRGREKEGGEEREGERREGERERRRETLRGPNTYTR